MVVKGIKTDELITRVNVVVGTDCGPRVFCVLVHYVNVVVGTDCWPRVFCIPVHYVNVVV